MKVLTPEKSSGTPLVMRRRRQHVGGGGGGGGGGTRRRRPEAAKATKSAKGGCENQRTRPETNAAAEKIWNKKLLMPSTRDVDNTRK